MASDRILLFAGADSTASSNYTSSDVLVVDAERISLSVITVTAGASRFTVVESNDDGFSEAINDRSVITTILADGIYTVDAGGRWLRVERSALESQATVTLQLRD